MIGTIPNGTMPATLVFGATGGVGRGVVEAALEAGRRVVAVSADGAALRQLKRRHRGDSLITLGAAITSDRDAAALAARLRALDVSIDGVVASIVGEHDCGRLLDQAADVLRRTLDEDLMPHLFAARHLFPLLPQDGSHGYVLIGGPGGDYPWAGYGHCSIAAAALQMMARVLHDEAGRHGLRVHLLNIDAPVRTAVNAGQACDAWPNAVSVGRRALALLERDAARKPLPAVVGYADAARLTSSALESAASRSAAARAPAGPAKPPPLPSPALAVRPRPVVRMRDLRDARQLLDQCASLPLPGSFEDEHS
jgi:NAD(P)-dependent dehydrogenase (short-subunit alcohol dehydrogenase family)